MTALALPAAALARVGVSGAAKNPLVHAALGATAPRQCAAVYISSVDKLWAAVFYKPAKGWGSRCKAVPRPPGQRCTTLAAAGGSTRAATATRAWPCTCRSPIRRDLQIPCYPLLP